MIKLLNTSKQVLHLLNQVKDYYTESDLATADKLIHFKIPKVLDAAADVKQEYYLLTVTDEYVIKEVNYRDKDFIEVFGKLNLEGLKGKIFSSYESNERALSLVMTDILVGTGWTSSFIDPIVKSRTITKENSSSYEILIDCAATYGVEYEFDSLNKVVKIYQTRGTDRGAYVYSDLNLKGSELQADSYDFVTRIYPYGKDGLSVSSVNDGVDYIDNNTYSTKIVEKYWYDERYTVAQALYDDAAAMLADLAIPRVSFSIDVINLKGTNAIYNVLDFQLGDTVKIIDKNNEVISSQRIVKLTEFPITPEKNKIEFSNTKIKFVGTSQKQIDAISQDIIRVRTDLSDAIDAVSSMITNSAKGYVVTRYSAANEPYEILIMDTDNVATATKVWRWNSGGLGYSSTGYNGTYSLAMTQDGAIVADFITAGTLNATIIKSGILQSADGSSWLNLADGTFSFGDGKISFNNNIFSINLAAAEIDEAGTTLAEALANKADQSAIDTINQYMTFNPATGLTLGQTGSPFQIAISNTEMDFKQSGTIVAYINGQKMYIDNAKILTALEVGNHKIRKYDANNTIVEYIG